MQSILLVTDGFPFGHREQSFIHSEYDALARRFRVFILAKDYGETEIQKGYEKIAAEKKPLLVGKVSDKKPSILDKIRNLQKIQSYKSDIIVSKNKTNEIC